MRSGRPIGSQPPFDMKMNYHKQIGIGIVLFLVMLLITDFMMAWVTGIPKADSSLDFVFQVNSNSVRGPVSVLRLSNNGYTTIRVDPFCTLYWTNHLAVATNSFF